MINAGLLGLGWWGKLIINTLKDSDKIRVTSASSRTMEKHKEYLEENKINAFPTYDQMLEENNIDAVIICEKPKILEHASINPSNYNARENSFIFLNVLLSNCKCSLYSE